MIDHHFRIQQSVMERKRESFLKHAANYNARMHVKDFQPGDIVFYVHNTTGQMFKKFQIKYDGPARIITKESDGNYKIENILTGRRFLIHANRLKPGSAEDQLFRRPLSSPTNKDINVQENGDDAPCDVPALERHNGQQEEREVPTPFSGPITRAKSRALHDAQGAGLNKVMVMNQNHYWDKLRHMSHG